MKISDILDVKGREVSTIGPNETLNSVFTHLASKRIGALVVADGDLRVLGIVSERDLVRAIAKDGERVLSWPVKIGERWLVDGALVNPVPITACRAMGADIVVAVSLSTANVGRGTVMANSMMSSPMAEAEMTVSKKPKDTSTGQESAERLLRRQILGRRDGPPGISSVMMQSFNIIQDRIARSRLAGDPPDILITPDVDDIGLFDFHKADVAIAAGYAAARPVIDRLTPFTQKREETAQTA